MRDDKTDIRMLAGTAGGPLPHGMGGIRMPKVYLPFPAHDPNPGLARAENALEAWLDASGICRSPASRRSLRRTRIPLITALAYPEAAPDTLELLAQWATWTFIVDDEFDDGPDGEDPARCAAALATLLPVLDGAPPADTASARAFAGTLARLTEGRSPGWCRALRHDISAYLWSYYEGLLDRLAHRVPTLPAYRRQRAVTVAAYTWLDLVETAEGIDLPEAVRHFSSFRDLREAVCEYVGLHNDLWSLERDEAAGCFHNAVLLVQRHDHQPLQEAVDQVNGMLTDCVRRMQAAERDLAVQLDAAGITGRSRADSLRCAEGYRKFLRGCFDYHYQVDRYTASTSASVPAAGRTDDTAPPHHLFRPVTASA